MATSERVWEIYTLTDPRTHEVRYVGVTCLGTEFRLRRHLSEARHRGRKNHRCNWIRGLLVEDHVPMLEVIETVSEDMWQEREQHWIRWHRGQGSPLVNMTDGGEGCPGATYDRGDEWRKKIGDAQRGKKRGPLSEETRRKISEAHTGSKRGPEARANMSAAHKGKRLSAETRAKLSEMRRGNNYGGVPVICIETGVVFQSSAHAARERGLDRTKVWSAIKRRGSAKGFHFVALQDGMMADAYVSGKLDIVEVPS